MGKRASLPATNITMRAMAEAKAAYYGYGLARKPQDASDAPVSDVLQGVQAYQPDRQEGYRHQLNRVAKAAA